MPQFRRLSWLEDPEEITHPTLKEKWHQPLSRESAAFHSCHNSLMFTRTKSPNAKHSYYPEPLKHLMADKIHRLQWI